MGFVCVFGDLDDDPHGNVQHIAEHDVSKEEVEEILEKLGVSHNGVRSRVIEGFSRDSDEASHCRKE